MYSINPFLASKSNFIIISFMSEINQVKEYEQKPIPLYIGKSAFSL